MAEESTKAVQIDPDTWMVSRGNAIIGYVEVSRGLFEARDAERFLVGLAESQQDAAGIVSDVFERSGNNSQWTGRWVLVATGLTFLAALIALVIVSP